MGRKYFSENEYKFKPAGRSVGLQQNWSGGMDDSSLDCKWGDNILEYNLN